MCPTKPLVFQSVPYPIFFRFIYLDDFSILYCDRHASILDSLHHIGYRFQLCTIQYRLFFFLQASRTPGKRPLVVSK